ncbi:MAG TPA: hypothetical protein VLJ37_06355 [bacterium]|nr:hypothetical protein [bacterium]
MNKSTLLILGLLASSLPLQAPAAPGDLDTSFSGDGLVTLDVSAGDDIPEDVVLQGDGKIVTAGYQSGDFLVIRFNPDGSLDTDFGTGGKVATDFGGNDSAQEIALQVDGKIVVAGATDVGFALARYHTDGSLDSGFGTGGKVTTPSPDLGSFAYAMAIQSDGKIVVVGQETVSFTDPPKDDFVLARYQTDGSLDTSFGTDGIVITDIGGDYDQAYAVAVQSDGKIVVTGAGNNSSTFATARYNSNGTLDISFGTGGLVTTDFGGAGAGAADLKIQADGKIVVAGYTNGGSDTDFALVRYNTNGSLDAAFGTGGKIITDISDGGAGDNINSIDLQEDGKIVAGGGAATDLLGFSQDFCVARYNVDGTLDTSFGGGAGFVTTDFQVGEGTDDIRAGIAGIQANGKIIAAGTFWDATAMDINYAIAKYLGNTADLAVSSSSDSAALNSPSSSALGVGDSTTFSILVHNNGPEDAGGADLRYDLPTSLSLVSASATQGSCAGTTTIFCDLGTIANGETATVTLVVHVNEGGTISNSLVGSAQVVDPVEGNNTSTLTLTTIEAASGGCQLLK